MRRRTLVVATGTGLTTLIAGCSDSTEGGSGTAREQIIDSREEVPEDEYLVFSFDANDQVEFEYEYTVRDGPDIDVFLLDDQEFDEFQAGNRFRPYSTVYGTSGGDTVVLDEDSYRLVIDNTNAGEVAPPTDFDDSVAEIEVSGWSG